MFGWRNIFEGPLLNKAGDKSAGGSSAPKEGQIIFTDQIRPTVKPETLVKPAVDSIQPINGKKKVLPLENLMASGKITPKPDQSVNTETVAPSKIEVVVSGQAEPQGAGENATLGNEGKDVVQESVVTPGVQTESNKKKRSVKHLMPHPLQVVEKRQLALSALHLKEGDVPAEAKEVYVDQLAKLQKKKRVITPADVDEARSLRKGILGSIQQKKIDAAEQIRKEEEERLAEEEKLARLETFKNENPEYYQKYEEEMDRLEPAFTQEFEASRVAFEAWESYLKRSNARLLKSKGESLGRAIVTTRMEALEALGQKITGLAETFNELDTRLPEDGLKGLLLLSEMQGLEKKMPKDIQLKKKKFLDQQEKVQYPNAERIEKGHIHVLIKRELEVLKRNCGKVRERDLFMTNTFRNIGQLEDHIRSLADLADSFDDETPIAEVEKTLDTLKTIENKAFSEAPPERTGRIGKGKNVMRLRKENESSTQIGMVSGKEGAIHTTGRQQPGTMELDDEGGFQEETIDSLWTRIQSIEKIFQEGAEKKTETEGRVARVNGLFDRAKKIHVAVTERNGAGSKRHELVALHEISIKLLEMLTREQRDIATRGSGISEQTKNQPEDPAKFKILKGKLYDFFNTIFPEQLAQATALTVLNSFRQSKRVSAGAQSGRGEREYEINRRCWPTELRDVYENLSAADRKAADGLIEKGGRSPLASIEKRIVAKKRDLKDALELLIGPDSGISGKFEEKDAEIVSSINDAKGNEAALENIGTTRKVSVRGDKKMMRKFLSAEMFLPDYASDPSAIGYLNSILDQEPSVEEKEREIFKIWKKKMNAAVRKRKAEEKRRPPSFESVVQESEQEQIVSLLQGFVDDGLTTIDEYLRQTSDQTLEEILASEKPASVPRLENENGSPEEIQASEKKLKDLQRLEEEVGQLLVAIGTKIVSISGAYGDDLNLISAIETKGKELLKASMSERMRRYVETQKKGV